jgi:hypothetical protein
MAETGNSFRIPHYISSESLEGLRAKMLENNLKDKQQHNYYQILHDGSQYVAFFYKIAVEENLVKRRIRQGR